ncbi:TonB-dependent receptor [Nitrospirillum viridazoti Y2]|uniref:TonB-dependent receptor-like protein n=1 Tax=Nitrospirillum amazonense TaxID=28077 RepID=A0A560IZI7_9PROT|nr:TonB-dependent receptor [Nitrospirillum amazonense]EGY01969.1 TonB-dependent receptor [Nitrospirillum amazonense Y2]TWB64442.1 TonB-dependent receptor-like protein [Nitrospirillum amazonense]
MSIKNRYWRIKPWFGVSAVALGMVLAAQAAHADPKSFDVPSQPAVNAIPAFAHQAGVEIVVAADKLQGIRTTAVKGTMEFRDALAILLQGTGLEVASDDGRVIALRAVVAPEARTTRATAGVRSAPEEPSEGLAEILVSARRTLNTDIRRTKDDIQPYVVFDSEELAQSGAQNVEDFLQSRLPMNASPSTQSQAGPPTSASGRLDLRGLGTDETLVLVDGRRLPSIPTGDSFGQPNINGIPISQIERIEVLPTTASGIYGGNATGGVINVILKRQYSGLDIETRYNNALDFAGGQTYVGANGGTTLEDGRTRIMGSFSRSQSRTLLASDRSFFRRGAQLQFRNDPLNSTVLLGGPNICSTVDGFDCVADALVLKSGPSLNAAVTSIPNGYAGNPADLAARAGKLIYDRSDLPIWTGPDVTTYNLNVRREFGESLEIFTDFSRDESTSKNITPIQYSLYIPESAPANPFQQDVLAFLNFPHALTQSQETTNTRVNVGGIIHLPYRWSASLEYDWLRNTGRSLSNVVLGPASDAAEELLQTAAFSDVRANPIANPASLFNIFSSSGRDGSTLQTASLRLGGPIIRLPGGDLTATALLEQRRESTDDKVNSSSIAGMPQYTWSPEARQDVKSGYLELNAPIVSASNEVPFIHELQLMGSVRHDNYETHYAGYAIPITSSTGPFPEDPEAKSNFSSTNFTLGFKYTPISDIAVRASWGNGFLAPKLANIRAEAPSMLGSFPIFLLNLRDPARGNELLSGPLTVLGGGNPNIQPEKSESFSAGVVLTPSFVPGLRTSVDLTTIRKNNEVQNLPVSFFLANEAAFPGRIIRGANLPGDAAGMPGPITAVDTSAINLANSRMNAIDIQADYDLKDTDLGSFRLYAAATHTLELSSRAAPGQPSVDRAGFFDGPLKWRANVGVDWQSGSWGAGWNTQIYASYRVCMSVQTAFTCSQSETWQGAAKVPSQNYSDIYVNYGFKEGVLANSEIRLGIQNILNQKPPTVASGVDQTGYSSFGDPRLQRFTLTLRKHF